jgi:hypothetical protein
LFGVAFTQPDKVHMREVDDPLWGHALALLEEMSATFSALDRRFAQVLADLASLRTLQTELSWSEDGAEDSPISAAAEGLLAELVDGVHMLALRSRQVWLLYRSRDRAATTSATGQLQVEARTVLKEARGE